MSGLPALEPAPGLRVRWLEAPGADPDPTRPAWELDGALRPGFSALRVLSAALEDGSSLLLAAARACDAAGHDGEVAAAVLMSGDGEAVELDEILISTQYGRDGAVRRLGLELYRPDEAYPLRAAADALATESHEEEDARRDVATMSFRLDGKAGTALHELIHAR